MRSDSLRAPAWLWLLVTHLIAIPHAAESFPGELIHQGIAVDKGPVSAGSRAFFTTREGSYPFLKHRLHVTDGTFDGTRRIETFCPTGCGVPPQLYGLPNGMALVTEHLPATGNKSLWASDGTEVGTSLLLFDRYGISILGIVGARAIVHERSLSGASTLWSTNGIDLEPLPNPNGASYQGIYPTFLRDGDLAWMVLNTGSSSVVIRTDGTPVGTVISPPLPDTPSLAVSLSRSLLLIGPPTGVPSISFLEFEPFVLTTIPIPTTLTVPFISWPEKTTFGAVFLVSAIDGRELWRTDGTLGGTVRVDVELPQPVDLPPFPPALVAESEGALFYLGGDGTRLDLQSIELSTGHRRVYESVCVGASTCGQIAEFGELVPVDGGLLYSTPDGTGRFRWRRTGLAGPPSDLPSTPAGESPITAPDHLTQELAGMAIFPAEGVGPGFDLWMTDGTWTERLSDLRLTELDWLAIEGSLSLALTNGKLLSGTYGSGGEIWAADLASAGAQCRPSPRSACLQENRFRVRSRWADFSGGGGMAFAIPLTTDTAYFWFFDPSNVEVVLKILDGRGVTGAHWVFYGALSNVDYKIDVLDMRTGTSRRYDNAAGNYASVGDTAAFPSAAVADLSEIEGSSAPHRSPTPTPVLQSDSCDPSETRLCLQQGRFAVAANWRDFQGNSGVGTAVPLSADTGYFWFFNDANVEAVIKVLDGRPVNDKFWVYYGALSNVEYTLTVTDTLTGAVKPYFNPSGRFASVGDNDAF